MAGWEHAVARGGVILFPLTTPFTVDARSAGSAVLRIPVQAAADLAEEHAGLPAADLRFESIGAISDAARGRFAQTNAYICAELVTSGITAFSPLIAHEMTRLAASVMLATFPNTTMTTPYLRGPGHVTPSAARRAAEVHRQPRRPAPPAGRHRRPAGVTPRALQYAFRRHYDAAPMSYLRRVRLERAHAELQAADPAAGHTVAAIARRWGFARPDRFAVAYRAVYGRPPSHTLRG
jgi:AraC-like DNA-binding protein